MSSKRERLVLELFASDQASKVVSGVSAEVEALQDSAEVELTAEDKATADIAQLRQRLSSLTGTEYTAVLTAQARKLQSEVDRANRLLADVDGEEAEAILDAKNDAAVKLAAVQTELDEIDRRTADAAIEADDNATRVIEGVDDELDALDRRPAAGVTVDATKGPGLAGILDEVDGLPGSISSIGPIVGRLTGPGAALGVGGLLVGGLAAAAGKAAELAGEAGTTAEMTGSTVEEAGRLHTVLRDQTNIEAGDLRDMIAQVNSMAQDNPELFQRLGVKLDEVRGGPLDLFITTVDALNKSQLDANDKLLIASQLFGEEGVRQIAELTAALGPGSTLRGEMDAISDNRLISDTDVEAARVFKLEWADTMAQLQGITLEIGQRILPLVNDLLALLPDINLDDVFTGDEFANIEKVFGRDSELMENFEALGGNLDNIAAGFFNANDAGAAMALGVNLFATDLEQRVIPDTEELTAATEDNTDATRDNIRRLEERRQALRDSTEAAERAARADRELADGVLDAREASRRAADAVDEYNKIKSEGAQEGESAAQFERRLEGALDGVVRAADDVAAATVDKTRRAREARGMTLGEIEATRLHSLALLNQARHLQGPMRQAVLEHIARINGIPPQRLTEILTDADPNDLAQVEAEINNAARNRSATIAIDTVFRHPVIRAHIDSTGTSVSVGRIVATAHARGTASARPGLALVGEEGPELVELAGGEKIHPANRSVQLLEQIANGAGGPPTTVHVYLPHGTAARDVARANRHLARVQGPGMGF